MKLNKKDFLREVKFNLLKAGGVDNWEGYDVSLEDYEPYEKMVEALDETEEPMNFYEWTEKRKTEKKAKLKYELHLNLQFSCMSVVRIL